jgi:HK97 family phage prohead protease
MQNSERRTLVAEVRLAAPDSRRLVGHAAVFGEVADIDGQFREVIAPGAFRKAIKGADVVARWNHNPDTILGRTESKTLRLSEDERGLAFELDIPNTTLGNDLLALVARGDVRGMSFAFAGARDKWDHATNTRTITDVGMLLDVSPVIEPAYAGTDVALRSRGEHLAAEQRERVSRLRNRLALYLAQQKEE